jgi:hypothetical protein
MGSYLRGGGSSFGVNGGRRKPTGSDEWSGGTIASVAREKGEEGKRKERRKKGLLDGLRLG